MRKQSGGLFSRRTRKHGGPKRRARHCPRLNGGQGARRKIHIGIDEQTLEFRAAEFTTSDVGEAPFVGELIHWINSLSALSYGFPWLPR